MFSVSLSMGDEKLVCLINWIPGSAAAKALSAFPQLDSDKRDHSF